MEIYLLRHGIAEDTAPSGRDADRRLTDKGREKLRKVLKVAADAEIVPSLILTSPLVRAVQTAEIAAEVLKYKGKLVKTDALLPDAAPRDVWNDVRVRKDHASILVAGHEPLFSMTTGYLLGCSREMVDFKKGALIRVDVESLGATPLGVLKWMIAPSIA